MTGSGPFGEWMAVERLQAAGGLLIMMGMIAFLFMFVKGMAPGNRKLHGLTMLAPSAVACTIYIVCMAGIELGWFEAGFGDRHLYQNFYGSLIGMGIGIGAANIDRLHDLVFARIDRRNGKV